MKHANSMFLPNIIKIDSYRFELYRFKVGAFFETQCRTDKGEVVRPTLYLHVTVTSYYCSL